MRALFVTLILGAVALSGCATDSAPVVEDSPELLTWSAGPASHPAFRYAESADLPVLGEVLIEGWPQYWYQPQALPLPEEIQALVPGPVLSNEVEGGAGITIFGSLAFVGDFSAQKIWAVDISNLEDPTVIGSLMGETQGADMDTIAFPPSEENPNGRLIVVASTRGNDMNVIDATDPTNMTLISTFQPAEGNHNHQNVPGTPLVYNAGSDGEGAPTSIWDLSVPEQPVEVQQFQNGFGCHAIDFFVNASLERYLGFCAGIEMTQVFDITDPMNPTVLSTVPWPIANQDVGVSGAVAPATFSHLAMSNHDGTVMIVGDETGGGLAPGCDFGVREPVTGTAASGPLGNLYFYDITDPTDPVLHGSVSPNAVDQRGACTAHFGGVIEDRNQLVMAFYSVGTVLIDFQDIDNPYVMDISGRDENDLQQCEPPYCGTWDSQYYRGAVITGSIDKGMGFLSFS